MAAPEKTQMPVGSVDAQAEAPVSIAPIESSAQLDPLLELDQLVATAMTAEASAQQKLSGEINAMMKLARETAAGRRAADELLGLLHSKKLEGFVAADGKSCRSMAVEQVLALGFPFALEVMPEDLDYHRQHERTLSPGANIALLALAALSAVYPWVELLPRLGASTEQLPSAAGVGAVTAAIAVLLMLAKPSSRRAKWLRRTLWLAGAVGLFIGSVMGALPAMWPGALAAVVAGAWLMPKAPKSAD